MRALEQAGTFCLHWGLAWFWAMSGAALVAGSVAIVLWQYLNVIAQYFGSAMPLIPLLDRFPVGGEVMLIALGSGAVLLGWGMLRYYSWAWSGAVVWHALATAYLTAGLVALWTGSGNSPLAPPEGFRPWLTAVWTIVILLSGGVTWRLTAPELRAAYAANALVPVAPVPAAVSAPVPPQVTAPPERRVSAWLEADGQRIPLTGPTITIGRGDDNTINLSQYVPATVALSSVSRQHAVIEVRNGQYLLRDIGSSNGTSINDTPLKPNGPSARLVSGDDLTFGHVQTRFVTGQDTPS